MNRAGNRFSPLLFSALIFLAAAAVHVLFFVVFRPVRAQNRTRPQKKRYTVMYRGGKSDPLKLAYWFRLDSGNSFSGTSAGKGYSTLIRPGGLSPKGLNMEDLHEKRTPLFGDLSPRSGGELDLADLPPLIVSSPSSKPLQSSADTVRFTDLSGTAIPGFSAGKSFPSGTGTTVLASDPDPSGMLPPRIRIIRSSGKPSFDRDARRLFAENLLVLPEQERKKGYTAVFECGRGTDEKEKEK